MGQDNQATKQAIPEPPKFNVEDLPEPPKLESDSFSPDKKDKEMEVPDPVMTNTEPGVIPPPPALEDEPKADEKPFSPDDLKKPEDIASESLSDLPEPPKKEEKKKKGLFSKLFKKKEKEEKVDLEPKMSDLPDPAPSIETEPKKEEKADLGQMDDSDFAPPGAVPEKEEKTEEPIKKEEPMPEMPDFENDSKEMEPDWAKEGEPFLESKSELEQKTPEEEPLPKIEETQKEEDWFKEGEPFVEEEGTELPFGDEEQKEEVEEPQVIEKEKKTPLSKVKGVGLKRAKKLKKAGIKTAEHLAEKSHKHVAKKAKIPLKHAKKIVKHAKKITKIKQRLKATKVKQKSDIANVVKQLEEERMNLEKLQKKGKLDEDKIIELEGHKDLIEVLEKLEKRRQELVEQEEKLADREIKLSKHDDSYKRDMEHIENLKRRLDYDIRERTQYLINLEKEYFQKAQDLARKQSEVGIKEKTFVEQEKFLKEKETNIKKRLNEIDDRSITLETKEKKFEKIMKDLEKQDHVLREKEDDLMKREEEYLKKLDALEGHETSILKNLEEKRKRLQLKGKELDAKEKKLHKKERNIDKRSIATEYAEKIMETEKGKILDDQFEQYLSDQLGNLKTTGISFDDMNLVKNITLPKVGRKHETIYQLIDTCKDLLSRKNVSEAKVFYNQIRERYYDKKFDSNKEKESIHNMIRSLYDEINLADIGTNM